MQDVWIQALADLGLVGFVLWTAVFQDPESALFQVGDEAVFFVANREVYGNQIDIGPEGALLRRAVASLRDGNQPVQFTSDDQILQAAADGQITLTDTEEFYRCSVVGPKH